MNERAREWEMNIEFRYQEFFVNVECALFSVVQCLLKNAVATKTTFCRKQSSAVVSVFVYLPTSLQFFIATHSVEREFFFCSYETRDPRSFH